MADEFVFKRPGAAVDTDAVWGTNGVARTGEIDISAVMPNDRITIDVEHDFEMIWGVGGASLDIGHSVVVNGIWGTNGTAIDIGVDEGGVLIEHEVFADPDPGLVV
ncbi:hypothetical protein ACQ5SO_20065 [Rhodovulum sp. DZ06]|uniref:hypothetical protein n=1 Tax=Rhodovulum sp. DZ06 TaxID=3425126 RepID=UPI003D347D57